MVSDSAMDMKFVDIPTSAYVEGVLKIPKSVLANSIQRLKAFAVTHFLGALPLFRVIATAMNLLWGYEGLVTVSRYLDKNSIQYVK
ncbi:hypothetical protein LINPERHAP1_LOCUS15971 [Linum perenne]